jgi:hypothetical protein
LRCLARIGSEPGGVSPDEKKEDIMRERQQLWGKAQAQRKRFCRYVVCTNKTKEGLDAAVTKASSVFSFAGKLNESHRAFVLSCDLLQELEAQPWSTFTCPKGPAFDARLAYLSSRSGPVDVCFLFDGRSRNARRTVEDHFDKVKVVLEETWIVYASTGSGGSGVGRSRKVCLASSTKEVMYCKLPVARVRLTTKPRQKFTAVGEDSTFHTTITGVPLARPSSLPRLSIDDKKAIFPSTTQTEAKPTTWVHEGVPLFWNEGKTQAFWQEWIQMFDIKAIIDVSPGSGQLGSAALNLGASYVGVCCDERHMSVLTNIADRDALRSIGESGSAVYQEELSVHIAEHFADVLEELNAEEASDDEEEADKAKE